MNYEDLTPEQKDKARACKTPKELVALAAAEGYELSDEELAAINGGASWDCISDCHDHMPCPQDR